MYRITTNEPGTSMALISFKNKNYSSDFLKNLYIYIFNPIYIKSLLLFYLPSNKTRFMIFYIFEKHTADVYIYFFFKLIESSYNLK